MAFHSITGPIIQVPNPPRSRAKSSLSPTLPANGASQGAFQLRAYFFITPPFQQTFHPERNNCRIMLEGAVLRIQVNCDPDETDFPAYNINTNCSDIS